MKMRCLPTNATVSRDQFKIVLMPDFHVTHITWLEESQGYKRCIDPDIGSTEVDNDVRDMQLAAPLPYLIAIDGRNEVVQLVDHFAIAPAAGVYDDPRKLGPEQQHDKGNGVNDPSFGLDDAPAQQIQISTPILAPPMSIKRLYLPAKNHGRDVDCRQSLQQHPSRAVLVRLAATDPVDGAPQRYRNKPREDQLIPGVHSSTHTLLESGS